MYGSIVTSGSQEPLRTRLTEAIQRLRSLVVTTKQDAWVEINGALANGNRMTPLQAITPFGRALIGDIQDNYSILNRDAQALMKQILNTENDASGLYNSFASLQNTLRQAIRETNYCSTVKSSPGGGGVLVGGGAALTQANGATLAAAGGAVSADVLLMTGVGLIVLGIGIAA